MHHHRLAERLRWLTLLCTLLLWCPVAAAQTEDEMQVLNMFFREQDLALSSTRNPKPISQIADNITVITAAEIEAMNAHTVGEVLNRVTGLFVIFQQGITSFGSTSLIRVQGTDARHLLVLIDGIQLNFLNSGAAETNSIPVAIIDRIEVIKGPASSAWGSSLGGVINILTKPAGKDRVPAGSLSGSYGEGRTQDYRGEVFGQVGPVGYFLYAGHQESEGLEPGRDFNDSSAYLKFHLPVSETGSLNLSAGYSEPENEFGDLPSQNLVTSGTTRLFFTKGTFNSHLSRELELNLSVHYLAQKFDQTVNVLSQGMLGETGDLFRDTTYDENTTGVDGRLVWQSGMHTAVVGFDYWWGGLDQTIRTGLFDQFFGAPPLTSTHPREESWAAYLNDTLLLDRWSITPGLRYDASTITDSFLSPSLGVTYRLASDTILRGSIARGFTTPPLSWISGGALSVEPNPDLEPERVWSYQVGVESSAAKYFWTKASAFYHDLDNTIVAERVSVDSGKFVNGGNTRRKGLEIEIETLPLYNLTLRGGFAYVDTDTSTEGSSERIYQFNVGLQYDDTRSFRAQLFGHFVDYALDPNANADYGDFIWDLNLDKRIYARKQFTATLFFTAHNLFDGSQYVFGDTQNPGRWVEAGIRFKF